MAETQRLLIVDDEPEILNLIEEHLKTLGYLISKAADGKEALKKIIDSMSEGPVDAVISDITMPHMDGLELLAEVRTLGMDIPFVFVTGFADREKTVQALRLGATDFLEKPYKRRVLVDAVKRAMQVSVLLKNVESEVAALGQKISMTEEQANFVRTARRELAILKADAQRAGHEVSSVDEAKKKASGE